MNKNRKQADVHYEIREVGNWNFRNPLDEKVFTKPIAVITIDGDEFVFCHADIMKVIRAYHEVDIKSIEMIRDGKAGKVKKAESPLLQKLKDFINELEMEDKYLRVSPFFKNGQTELNL